MVGHRPPNDRPRAEVQHHGEIEPAFACGERGNIPNGDGIGLCHGKLPVALVWGHRLDLAGARRRFECAPRFAASACLGQHASNAATAHYESFLREQILDPARAVRATPLGKTARNFVLQLLISFSSNAGWAVEPLVVATARDRQELTHATHLELSGLLVYPRVLHGSCCAKYAAAFFKISRSSFKRVFSFRRRFSSS